MKQQKRDGKGKQALSFWLQRMRVDRRIQMVCLFVLAMAGILFVLNRYHTRYIRNLEYDSTAVTSQELFDGLKQGTAEIGNTVRLSHFAADEPIYKRGSHYYIGEDYAQMQDGAPLFVNEGTYVNLIGADGVLITADWEEEAAMAGMYISSGQSFNFDGTMVEDEEILFLRMDNGLYLNTRELYLNGLQQKTGVPANSFLHISENGVRYYARQDGIEMIYGSFTQTFEATVEIGGQAMSFEEFLEKLGIVTGNETETFQRAETEEEETETEPETAEETANETNAAEESLENEEEKLQESAALGDDNRGQNGASSGTGGQGTVLGEDGWLAEEETTGSAWGAGQELPDFLDDSKGGNRHNYDWDSGNGSSGGWDSNQNSGGSGWGTENGSGSGNGTNSGSGNGSGTSNGTNSGTGNGSGTGSGSGTGGSGSGTGSGGNGSGSGGGTSGGGNETGSGGGNGGGSGTDGTGSGTGGSGSENGGIGTGSGSGTGSGGTGTGSGSGTGGGTGSGGTGTGGSGTGTETPVSPATDSNASGKPTTPATGGNAGQKPGTGGDGTGDGNGSGDGPTYEIEWKKPEISLSQIETDVYSAVGTLEVEDSYGSFSRVSLAMAWDTTTSAKPDENTAVQYRKTLKTDGGFQIDNLPPDTWIYVSAYLQYYDENGKKIKETEPFKTMLIKTEPFSSVDHIYIQFSDDIADSKEGRYYENQMSAYDLHISSSNGYLLDKIYRGVIKVYSKDNRNQAVTFSLSSNALKRHKLAPQDYVTLLSQNSLQANQEYRYEFEFWDRFGNSFMEAGKVYWGREESVTGTDNYKASGFDKSGVLYEPGQGAAWEPGKVLGTGRFWGYTHTSKTLPSADIGQISIEEIRNTLSMARLTVKIKDIHDALVPDGALSAGTGSYDQISGSAPAAERGSYKLYYGLYSVSGGTAIGNEISTKAVLSDDGKTVIIQEDEAGTPYQYLDSASLPSGDGSAVYQVEGLTAGETYMIRVFGTYDLNDNYAAGGTDQELGNMRFTTTSMASYGRIYYTFASEHIHTEAPAGVETYDHERYESATAQRIRMTVNTSRTNATLAEVYYNRFLIKMRYRSDSNPFLQMEFSRDGDGTLPGLINREITVSESQLTDGVYTYEMKGLAAGQTADQSYDYRYQINGSDMTEDKLPKIVMEIPVASLPDRIVTISDNGGEKSYSFNLWDAFLSIDQTDGTYGFAEGAARTMLYMTFGEGSLKSYTSYVAVTESYAAQGTLESHDVTSSTNAYRQCSFTTLKEMPYVTIGGVLQVGRYLYLVDLQFHDTDKSIYQGEVQLRNVNLTANNATSTQTEILDYAGSPDGGGEIGKATFTSLRMGSDYRLQIVPVDIRRTGGTGQPRIQNVSLKDYEYTAGKGVTGSIFLSGITYPLKELTEGEGDTASYRTVSDYNKYEVGNFTYGTMSGSTGTPLTVNESNNYTYGVMDAISVNPGQIYYLHNLAGSTSSDTTSIAFLDISGNLVGPVRTIYSDSFIRIPEGVRYMRVQMAGSRSAGGRTNLVNLSQAQALLIYDDSDSALKNKLKMVSAPSKDSQTATFTFNKEQLLAGDVIALTNGEWTSGMENGMVSLDYTFTDGNGKTTGGTVSVYSGYALKVPEGAVSAEVKVTTALYVADDKQVQPDLRIVNTGRVSVFSQYYFDTLISSYQAEVYDYSGSLNKDSLSGAVKLEVTAYDASGNPEGTLEKAGLSGKVGQYQTDGTNGYYEGNNNFETENGYTYRLSLSVCWRGDYYPLDEQEFTAQGNQYSIATSRQMLKMVTWPTGKFLVTADLGTIEPYTLSGLNQVFYGHLNGQGHSFDMKVTGGGTFLSTLGGTGILENLEISETLGNSNANMNYVYPIGTNRGTIRNVILHMNTGTGNYRHYRVAGICDMNRGVIENFALYFTYPSASAGNYMSNASGGITCYNSGVIRNGVVYGSRTLDVTTGLWGGSEEVSMSSVGGVAGVNESSGTIEQVMTIMNMRVEHNANVLGPEATMGSYGLIAGSNSGMVKNCFTNGEISYGYWELNSSNVYQLRYTSGNNSIAWPGGNYSSQTTAQNCFYFSSGKYRADNAYVSYQSGTTALRSASFYDATVNKEQGFVVESQLAGDYYPIIAMPECMDGLQTNIPLTAALPGNMPTYLSTAVLKKGQEDMTYLEHDILPAELVAELKAMTDGDHTISWEDYFTEREDGSAEVIRQFALAKVSVTNKLGYLLDNVKVKSLNTKVLSVSDDSGITDLTVLMTPYLEGSDGELQLSTSRDSFTSTYQMESLDYGYTASAMRTMTVADQTFAMELFYPLSAETWNTAPAGTAVNYRLTEDIRFAPEGGSFEEESVRRKALTFFSDTNNCGSMGGIFDGNNHVLDFEGASPSAFYFRQILAGGQVRNLTVENLTLKGSTSTAYLGFIRTADAKASLSGIHMRNVTLDSAYQYAGPLAAYVSTSTIENCTVVGASVTSGSNTSKLYAGGMIGYNTGATFLRNSFVRDLDMNIMEGVTVGGTGGLAGYYYSSSSVSYARITSCYAEGRIQTAFANCGGLFGIGNGQVSGVWTAVDIIGTNNMGSLVGYAMATGDNNFNTYTSAVVSGELYSSTQAISRRLIGTWERTATETLWTYAYEGQLLNSNTSAETMDVSEVRDAESMKSYYFWTDEAGMGEGFCLYGADGIRDVTEASVYPILYETDGETLLPDQAEVSYQVVRPAFEVVEARAEDNGITDAEPYGDYKLELTAKIEGAVSGTAADSLKDSVKAEGLDFTGSTLTTEVKTETDAEGKAVQNTYVTIAGIKATGRFDSYRLDYEYEQGKTVSTKLEFLDTAGQPVYLYWKLKNAQDWATKMTECGHRYENFMICGDIDLSNSSVTQLKLNRLVGEKKAASAYKNRSQTWINTPEFYVLKNMRIPSAYGAWISEIATYMGYLDIRGCSLTGAVAAEKFGLVGNVVGDVEYVDFYNNTILVGTGTSTYNYLGCIGYIGNNASNVRLSGITIGSQAGDSYYYSYVGGLSGYARTLNGISGYDCRITMGNNTTTISRSYFGGIVGYVPTEAHQVYGENMNVTGRNSTGGLLGGLYQTTSENSLLEEPDFEGISITVTGGSNVGGLVGSSGYNCNFKNMRVIDANVRAYVSYAGGIVGHGNYYGVKTYLEAYGCQVASDGNYAGGICGTINGTGYISKSKTADCTVKAGGNYAGGILGGAHGYAYQNAVYRGSVDAKSYVGGIVGYVINSNASGIGTGKNIYRNVVSGVRVTAETNYAGGVVGAVCGAVLYENQVMDTTEVKAMIGSGGLVGYSSGGVMRNNIIGAKVTGTNNVGGLAGQVLGYGVSFTAGTAMTNNVAKAYGNLIACESIYGNGNYIAGLIGFYDPGDEPIDGDGNVIPNSGYTEWMTNENFYGNAILAGEIKAENTSSRRISWYANYTGDNQHYLTHVPNARYDCVIDTLAVSQNNNLAFPNMSSATKVTENGAVKITAAILGTQEFYTNKNSAGGLEFNASDYDWSGLKNYYPYIGNSEKDEIGLVPYQSTGAVTAANGRNWNTYFKKDDVTGEWSEVNFDGFGIPNPAAASTLNLRSVARGMVYPSGVNTINIDFSGVDTSLVTFEIVGYLEETSIDTLENSAWVCSLTYDYETSFVLNLYSLDHSVKETYSYRPEDLRSTIMNWGGKNYYLRSDGIYQGGEDGASVCVLEGTFVNLYQGQALEAGGQVYNLSGLPAKENADSAKEGE